MRDSSGGGVFVKQAPPYIKCLGADYGLPAERMLLESAAIDLYGRVAPGTVPRHLHLDPQRCVMVLELLDGYELMRTALRAGRADSTLAEFNDFCMHASEVGTFMGRTHKATHRDRVPAAERAALEAQFANATMCGITADYVFTKPLDAADPTNKCSAAVAGLEQHEHGQLGYAQQRHRGRARYERLAVRAHAFLEVLAVRVRVVAVAAVALGRRVVQRRWRRVQGVHAVGRDVVHV